jgi:CheY-like chemotaxis protein
MEFISALTTRLGCKITTARNGKEAVEQCHIQKFDVILMDLAMPIMCGLEASKLIKNSDNPNQTTPIVAVTADNDPIVKAGCCNFGIHYYLTKPICKTNLHRIISECKAAN